jgi:hypothetical protein
MENIIKNLVSARPQIVKALTISRSMKNLFYGIIIEIKSVVSQTCGCIRARVER